MIFELIIKNEKDKLISVLEKEQVNLNERNKYGNTPLHVACQEGKADIVKILLDYPLDINAKGIDDYSALHYAVQKRNPEIVKLLLAKNANIDSQDKEGNTPLWTAVMTYSGNDEVIKLLLDGGADPRIPNKHGITLFKLLDMPKNRKIKGLFGEA